MNDQHRIFMRRALELARNGWGLTHPNPMVGAVIVEDGRVAGEGFHSRSGQPHAEIEALSQIGREPNQSAILVTTLEPCSTQGRTGSCTDAIIAAGIGNVVIGATDPNPSHRGRGARVLRDAGIGVTEGVLEDDCNDLNLVYNHWITASEPLIAAKAALTLDGKIATRSRHSKWITGSQARGDVMRWRRLFPAIAVGAGTVLQDDPQLTSRRDGESVWCPRRFVFDPGLRTVSDSDPLPKVYDDRYRGETVVVAADLCDDRRADRLRDAGVGLWKLPHDENGLSFPEFRGRCARDGITGVLVEGGSETFERLFAARCVDYFFAFRAPVLLGDEKALGVFGGNTSRKVSDGIRLTSVRHMNFGEDSATRGFVVYPNR